MTKCDGRHFGIQPSAPELSTPPFRGRAGRPGRMLLQAGPGSRGARCRRPRRTRPRGVRNCSSAVISAGSRPARPAPPSRSGASSASARVKPRAHGRAIASWHSSKRSSRSRWPSARSRRVEVEAVAHRLPEMVLGDDGQRDPTAVGTGEHAVTRRAARRFGPPAQHVARARPRPRRDHVGHRDVDALALAGLDPLAPTPRRCRTRPPFPRRGRRSGPAGSRAASPARGASAPASAW